MRGIWYIPVDMRWRSPWVRRWETVAAAVIAACGLGVLRFTLPIPAAIAEAILVLAILAPLASPAMIAIIRRTPIVQRSVLGGIFAAFLIGHFHGKISDTFPFVEWDIYTYVPTGRIELFAYSAVRRDGTPEDLVPAHLFPALRKKLAVHLEQVAAAIEAAAGATPPEQARRVELTRQYDGLLRAMARAYNREHAGNPLVAIRIEPWTVPIEGYAGRQSIVRHPIRLWRLEGETE